MEKKKIGYKIDRLQGSYLLKGFKIDTKLIEIYIVFLYIVSENYLTPSKCKVRRHQQEDDQILGSTGEK